MRSFIRGDKNMVSTAMTRLYGSDDIFPDQVTNAYHAYQSVNFITSHDGLCLYDLVCRNETNGAADSLTLRRQQIKNYCCMLLASKGTPMFVAGNEFMRTQNGADNPYNQDNETSWINWSLLERNHDVFRFFRHMIAFRKAHPTLCRSRFWRDDICWYGAGPEVDQSEGSHTLAFFLRGKSQQDSDLYVMINTSPKDVNFRILQGGGHSWRQVVDTSLASPQDIVEPGREAPIEGIDYGVKARSVAVLIR